MSTTVFLPNYLSENVTTNSIRPVSACLAFFEAIWHFFTSGLAFLVHLDLATLVRISGTVIVRRVRGKMDKFVVVQRKRKRSSLRERDFCKRDRIDTSSCSESASQVFNSKNDIGNFVGVPLTDAD